MTFFRKFSAIRRSGFAAVMAVMCAFLLLASVAGPSFAQDAEPEDPVDIFNKAQDAHASGDLKTAIELYSKAIEIAPEFPEAEYQRAVAYRDLGKLDDAEKGFRRALEIREDWTLALAALGSLLAKKENYAEAAPILEKAIKLEPQNFPAYAALVDIRIRTNALPAELQNLLARISELTAKANPPASIWIARAELEREIGKLSDADQSASNALTVDPHNITAKYLRADIALRSGDTMKAHAFADDIAATGPDSIDQKMLNANILVAEGKYDEALDVLKPIENAPPDVAELRERLTIQTSTNIAEIEKIAADDPKDIEAVSRLCGLYRTKDPIKALEYCKQAAELEPQNISHAVGFGAALVTAKRYGDAAMILRKLLAYQPDNFTVRANLATALFQMNNFAEAKVEFQKLTEMRKDLAPAYYFLGICHDRLGEYLDAMANYQSFLRLADPTVSQLEIDKVNLRLPILQRQIKNKEGKRNE
jgi:tetratricopeptide (TPR) repeat protein